MTAVAEPARGGGIGQSGRVPSPGAVFLGRSPTVTRWPGGPVGRGTGRGPGAVRTGCVLCFLRLFFVQSVQLVRPGRGAVPMVRRRSTVRFRKGAPRSGTYFGVKFD